MKIYCLCNFCNTKIYLASNAESRQQLSKRWGVSFLLNCSSCKSQNQIEINNVIAEPSYDKIPISTTIGGGLLGILAGPLGIAIGLLAGRGADSIIHSKDKEVTRIFNRDYL